MSCHKLKIETGRYARSKTLLENRTCTLCDVLDDVYHALFECKAHRMIRRQYNELLRTHDNVEKIFNPTTINSATKITTYLSEIEDNMKDLRMVK